MYIWKVSIFNWALPWHRNGIQCVTSIFDIHVFIICVIVLTCFIWEKNGTRWYYTKCIRRSRLYVSDTFWQGNACDIYIYLEGIGFTLTYAKNGISCVTSIFSSDQAALHTAMSVHLSVRRSVGLSTLAFVHNKSSRNLPMVTKFGVNIHLDKG